MTETKDQLERELRKVSPEIGSVSLLEKVDGTQQFYLKPARLLTTDEMVAICQQLAREIRKRIPERPDGWAALIHFWQHGGSLMQPMGVYFFGWAGRADCWQLYKGQDRKATDHADWLALRERLRTVLSAFGTEGETTPREGDFALMGGETFPREMWLYINRIEFLTREVITAIQDLLRDGYSEWMVDAGLNLPPPFEILERGIEIRVHGVREMWDRRLMEEMLGDRLKI
jgi:hypothetical protein